MKKSFLILAAVSALAPAFAQAQSSVSVYGVIDTSIDRIDDGTRTSTQLVSNASRLGFRGAEDLGSGYKALFGIEAGLNVDTGAFSSSTNHFRNSFVALTGPFGAVALGRLDSANPTGSPLYSQRSKHLDAVIHDAGATAFGTEFLNLRNRVSNAIGYMSPTFGGFNMRARYWQTGPETPTGTGPGVTREQDFKHLDVGLNYESGPFGVGSGLGKDSKRGGLLANDFKDKWHIVGSYDFKVVKAYGIYGRDRYEGRPTTRSDVDFWMIGASAPVGSGEITANYMRRDVQRDRTGEASKFQIGYGHSLSKRTTLYAIFDRQDDNSNVGNDETRVVSLGIQHKF